MAGKIIMCIISLLCTIMFFCIGIYAKKSSKPMGFWSGHQIDASKITDIQKYNNDNAIMWKIYSMLYFASALSAIFSPLVAAVLIIISCTLGLGVLIVAYNKICKQYMIK